MNGTPREDAENLAPADQNTVAAAAQTARRAASETMSQLSDAAQQAADGARAAAASLASQTGDRLHDFLREQIRFGADRGREAADAARKFAGQLDENSPHAAVQVRSAADRIDDLAKRAHDIEPSELYDMAGGLARRQPLAFAGAALATGFLIARFFKSRRRPNASGATLSPVSTAAATEIGRLDDA